MSSKFRSHHYYISGLVAYASFYAMKNILLLSCLLVLLATYCHGQAPNICYNDQSNTFLPDITNCSRYYACVNNVPYEQSCPNGYIFDSETQSCNFPSVAKCLTCPAGSGNNLTFLAIPSACNKYVICAGNNSFVQTCYGALEFNSATNQCDFASNVHCSGPPVTCPNNASSSNSLVYVPAGGGCTKFTICYKGTPSPQECAAGTYFDPTQNACTTSYSCPSSSPATSARQFDIYTAPIASSQSYEMKRKTVSCPKSGVKSLPYGGDCSRYVACVNGMSALRTCPDGLHFDVKTETCRIPPLAKCQSGI